MQAQIREEASGVLKLDHNYNNNSLKPNVIEGTVGYDGNRWAGYSRRSVPVDN